jgi:tripartite-type tricarboxylate transporter receptor subunit TctC
MNRISASRRQFALAGIAVATALATAPFGASAADAWPTKPVTIVVPFAAGGTTDILARVIGQALTK